MSKNGDNAQNKNAAQAEPDEVKPPSWVERHFGSHYVFMLVSLLLLSFLLPIVGDPARLFGISVFDICICAILISAVRAVAETRRATIIALAVVIPMLILTGISNLVPSKPIDFVEHILFAIFFAFTMCVILRDVLSAGKITGHKIVGAICVYLFLGIIWGFLYSLTEMLSPGSFSAAGVTVTGDAAVPRRLYFSHITYYSFVTLSTLGYGDIVPVKPVSRMLSWMEAVTGQLYIAILIARLVALHVTQTSGWDTHGDWRSPRTHAGTNERVHDHASPFVGGGSEPDKEDS
ncbi:MAG: hypothetical protein GXP25_22005 [Planctomycetes bacterium]|nr:hypothetical protein [Planctomycetota bacterium]